MLAGCLQANIICIQKQLRYFKQYRSQVRRLVGAAAANRLVESALVLITLGGSDFVNNYYLLPFSAPVRYSFPVRAAPGSPSCDAVLGRSGSLIATRKESGEEIVPCCWMTCCVLLRAL